MVQCRGAASASPSLSLKAVTTVTFVPCVFCHRGGKEGVDQNSPGLAELPDVRPVHQPFPKQVLTDELDLFLPTGAASNANQLSAEHQAEPSKTLPALLHVDEPALSSCLQIQVDVQQPHMPLTHNQ